MKYEDILSEEMKKEIDTDYGVLRAYWSTGKRLIEKCLRSGTSQETYTECLKFYQEFYKQLGEFKANEFRGDMIDFGIACYNGKREIVKNSVGLA